MALRCTAVFMLALFTVPAARGQYPGVLIGFVEQRAEYDEQNFGQVKEPKYQTLWVALDATGKLSVQATIPNLIVPRMDGFWHVGVKQVCEFDSRIQLHGDGNEFISQVLWSEPAAKPGIIEVDRSCTANGGPSECGFSTTDIEYISPVLISLRTYGGKTELCEPRSGHTYEDYLVVGYDSRETLRVGQLLGQKALEAYQRDLPDKGTGDDGEDCETQPAADNGWRIARDEGRWAIFAHQSSGPFNCRADARVHFRLPSKLTGDNTIVPDYNKLKSKEYVLLDAYVSPAKDVVILVTGSELRFHEYVGGGLGKLLLTVPAYPIVMLQWATGTHVQEWTKQLQEIVKHPLPEPEIRVTPPAKQPADN